jgi:hypothetical protein
VSRDGVACGPDVGQVELERADLDMITRLMTRVENAMREDIRALWRDTGDLRRRIEALEGEDR